MLCDPLVVLQGASCDTQRTPLRLKPFGSLLQQDQHNNFSRGFRRPLITPLHVAVSRPQLLPLTAAEFKFVINSHEDTTCGRAGITQEWHSIPPVLQRQYSERGNAFTHLFPHCLQPHLYQQHLVTTIFPRSFACMHYAQPRAHVMSFSLLRNVLPSQRLQAGALQPRAVNGEYCDSFILETTTHRSMRTPTCCYVGKTTRGCFAK